MTLLIDKIVCHVDSNVCLQGVEEYTVHNVYGIYIINAPIDSIIIRQQ